MYTDFFNAATGTGSEMASASDLPSDLQLHHLCETPPSLMAALAFSMGLTHTLKFPCVSNTIFCNSNSRRKSWGSGHTPLSKVFCFLMPEEVSDAREEHALQMHLAPVTTFMS